MLHPLDNNVKTSIIKTYSNQSHLSGQDSRFPGHTGTPGGYIGHR